MLLANNPIPKSFAILCFCLIAGACLGQTTIIRGKITDAETGEALPAVTIVFQGTTVGTISNFDGSYTLESNRPADSVSISFIGYASQTHPVIQGEEQELNVSLNTDAVALEAFELKADKKAKNPALIFIKKAIQNKDDNDPYGHDFLQYEVYTKIELDLNNIDPELQDRKVMRKFGFMFDQKVEGDSNTKPYIPVILAENVSEYYYRKSPKAEHEIIKGSKISGIKNESINEQLANTALKINLYDSYINIFGKGFVSPMAETGPLFYRYYFLDSLDIDGTFCYHMSIVPRRQEDLVFSGELWISKTSYAIVKADLKLAKNANLNWVNGIELRQDFAPVGDVYLLQKEFTLIDFNLTSKRTSTGLYARRNSSYTDIKLDIPQADSVYEGQLSIADSAYDRGAEFWTTERHDSLSPQEQVIYTNVERLQKIPFFMSLKDLATTVLTGYKTWGMVDVGPYLKLVTHNPIEGVRVRLGMRTNASMSKKIRLHGHMAYGFLDERLKYGGGILYQPRKDPRTALGVNYTYDIEQIGQSPTAYPVDHVLGSLLRRRPLDKLSMARELEVFAQKEWKRSVSSTIAVVGRDVFANPFDSFDAFGGFIRTTELRLSTRIAPGENVIIGDFERTVLGSQKPELQLQYSYGIPNPTLGDFEFHRASVDFKHRFNLGALGYSKYYVSGGKTWGDLPYVLLNVLPGNENYTFDHLSYNLMNYYEFAVDEYVSLYYTHYFDGLFLNKVPVVKKLQLRELIWGKGIVGNTRNSHETVHPFPNFLNSLNRPYYEAGFGVENFLKVLRFDCFWRLSHLDRANVSNFAVRGSLQVKF